MECTTPILIGGHCIQYIHTLHDIEEDCDCEEWEFCVYVVQQHTVLPAKSH